MMMIRIALLAVLTVLLTCRTAFPGFGRIEAGTEGVFTQDHCSVIIAKVDRVWAERSPEGEDDTVQFWCRSRRLPEHLIRACTPRCRSVLCRWCSISSIKAPPVAGATVLVVRPGRCLGPG
jgi:hypothetical protein